MNLKKRTVLHQNGDERVSPSYLSLKDSTTIHILWVTPTNSSQSDTFQVKSTSPVKYTSALLPSQYYVYLPLDFKVKSIYGTEISKYVISTE